MGELLRLAGPVVLSRLGIMAMGLCDVIVVGRHSATELGYLGLGWAPTSVVLVTGLGLLAGTQVMTSRAIGAGRAAETGAVLRRGLTYALWLGVASTLVLALLGPPVMRAIGLDAALADGASRVLVVLALSMTPILLADGVMLWFEAHGRPMFATWAMAAANVVNLGLNLWLVPGDSPFPVEGAVAAAWTTGIARTFLLAVLLLTLWRWRGSRAAGVFRRAPRDPAGAAEQRRIGYGSGASYGIETGAFSFLNIIAGWLGALVIAGWTVVLNVAGVVFMVPLGLASATAVLVGRAVGAGDVRAARRAFWMGIGVTTAALALISFVVMVWPEGVARAYTSDPVLVALVAPALLLSGLFFVADGLQNVAAQALRARGDVWWPTGLHFTSYLVVMLPASWWLSTRIGLDGIVWGVIVASLFSAVVLIARFRLLGDRLPDKPGEMH